MLVRLPQKISSGMPAFSSGHIFPKLIPMPFAMCKSSLFPGRVPRQQVLSFLWVEPFRQEPERIRITKTPKLKSEPMMIKANGWNLPGTRSRLAPSLRARFLHVIERSCGPPNVLESPLAEFLGVLQTWFQLFGAMSVNKCFQELVKAVACPIPTIHSCPSLLCLQWSCVWSIAKLCSGHNSAELPLWFGDGLHCFGMPGRGRRMVDDTLMNESLQIDISILLWRLANEPRCMYKKSHCSEQWGFLYMPLGSFASRQRRIWNINLQWLVHEGIIHHPATPAWHPKAMEAVTRSQRQLSRIMSRVGFWCDPVMQDAHKHCVAHFWSVRKQTWSFLSGQDHER